MIYKTINLTPFESIFGIGMKASHTASMSEMSVWKSSKSNLRTIAASVRYNSALAKLQGVNGRTKSSSSIELTFARRTSLVHVRRQTDQSNGFLIATSLVETLLAHRISQGVCTKALLSSIRPSQPE